MDYFGILKKAWNITWKYKMLWVLGLFAGAGSSSGSSGGSSNYSGSSGDFGGSGADSFAQMERWFSENILLVAIVAGVLVIIGFLWWILSVAAQGGLVHGANEAAEGRTPSLKASWGVGFSRWGRTFMISFVLGLPVLVVAIVLAVLMFALIAGGAATQEAAGATAGAIGGLCVVLPIFVVVIIAMSIIISIVYQLALRYGVLDDITFGQAIKRGWDDLWAKRGAFVMSLVMILPGFVVGLVMLLFMLPFMVPAIAFIMAEKFVMAGAFFLLMALVMLLPTAVYGTFISSAWTVFFREMTGREPSTRSAPVYAPPAAPYAVEPMPPVVDVPSPPAVDQGVPEPMAEEPLVYVEAPEPPTADAGFAVPTDEAPPADV